MFRDETLWWKLDINSSDDASGFKPAETPSVAHRLKIIQIDNMDILDKILRFLSHHQPE